MRKYLILSETTTVLLQDKINAMNNTHKDMKVHSFVGKVSADGTYFMALISYEG